MTYNALTSGIRTTADADYPNDTLVTVGFHQLVREVIAVGFISATESDTAPGAPSLNQLWYRPDSGLAASDAPVGDSALFRWDGTVWQPMSPTQFAAYLQLFMALPGGGGGGGGSLTDGVYGQITVSGGGTIFTINTNTVTNARLADMPALTIKANPTNASVDPQDFAPTADHQVLRRNGNSLEWALLGTNNLSDDAVTNAKLANAVAYSLKGNNTAAGANPTDIRKADLTSDTTPVAGDAYLAFDSVTGELKIIEHQYVSAVSPLNGTGIGSYLLLLIGSGQTVPATISGGNIKEFGGANTAPTYPGTGAVLGYSGTWAYRGGSKGVGGTSSGTGDSYLYQRTA